MAELLLRGTFRPGRPDHRAPERRGRLGSRIIRGVLWAAAIALGALLGWSAMLEMRTSFAQSLLFSRLTKDMTFTVHPGAADDTEFPRGGPHDERVGYAKLPQFLQALATHDFAIERQARLSSRLREFIANGGYAIYHEKPRAGLMLVDRSGAPFYAARYPEQIYESFAAIPPIVVDSLLFIEDRYLLNTQYPDRNPAVDWERFLRATVGRVAGWLDPRLRAGGASTLATQIEKFRHSPGGRTANIAEKLRQMVSAAARAYLDGPDTTQARQQIVTTYLNATPLGSRPGYGEIIGIGDGLKAWYGTDFAEASRTLTEPTITTLALPRKAEIYKQVLSLLLAGRRPSHYLILDRKALGSLTDRYLRLLGEAGVIGAELRDAALAAELRFRTEPPASASVSFVERKAADAVRVELLSLFRMPSLYGLDRLDLTARTTLDAATQARLTAVLSRLGDPDYVKSRGLVGHNLLGTADPAGVTYSIVVYESGADRNMLRVRADSLNEPFDINSGAKLILGSTAKLRTLITYLDIVTELHRRYGQTPSHQLPSATAQDPLTRWAVGYLSAAADRSLQPMLDAAMQRRYSASPNEAFFTNGGTHVFHNFEKTEDGEAPTVEDAFRRSINLAFVRLLRDISHYYIAARGEPVKTLMSDRDDPEREIYLQRFADEEGRRYLNRFWDDYRGLAPDDALALLANRTRPAAHRLAVIFRSVRPQAGVSELHDFLAMRMPGLSLDNATIAGLYAKYAADRFSLADRGYLAGVHPLELFLVTYLLSHPGASRDEVLRASVGERQEAYRWLFKTHNAHKQDVRIRILLEEDAFNEILQDWRRQGYPFARLIPSLATAIGSSGDRPDALAELMGIILNDGLKQPTVDLEHLHFATETPYETELALEPAAPQRILAPEVARTVRKVLMGVVAHGTGERLRNVYRAADGSPLAVGGKTGTGDNRFERFGPGRRLIDSRVVDRTATFVFFLGDRFFGTVTVYVPGPDAAKYHFTSALAVQLLASLAPELQPLIDAPAAETPGKVQAGGEPRQAPSS